MSRLKAPHVFAALFVYSATTYVFYHGYQVYLLPAAKKDAHLPHNQHKLPPNAEKYDQTLNDSQTVFWDVFGRRRSLLHKAHGVCLETSCGTLRNLSEYNLHSVDSLTMVDLDPQMVRLATEKLPEANPSKLSCLVMDSESLAFAANSFDTVIQTFGLCSVANPVKSLREMNRVLKPAGKILLVEHGRTSHTLLNTVLDKTSAAHAAKFGCWWNRDIVGLLAQADMNVESIDTADFGTTYYVVCGKSTRAQSAAI